jgi:hypothetical protein
VNNNRNDMFVFVGQRCRIRGEWEGAGRTGQTLGRDQHIGGIMWTPVLWTDAEDPDWHKTEGLEFEQTSWKGRDGE